jgi:G3E family GTPase
MLIIASLREANVCRQIASSDCIILNKCDIAKPSDLDGLEKHARKLNPHVPIHRTSRGAIDVGKIIGIDAFRSRPDFRLADFHDDQENDHDHDHAAEAHQAHLHAISSLQIPVPPLDNAQFEKLDEWLRSLLWEDCLPSQTNESVEITNEKSMEILRAKGYFTLKDPPPGSSGQHMLQAVRTLYEVTEVPLDKASPDAAGGGKLVLIGKGLGPHVKDSFNTYLSL